MKPEECVAVEDSRSGATAAKRANILLIGYVGPYDEQERKKMVKVLRDEVLRRSCTISLSSLSV